jgi:hypothetical protein
VYALAAAVSAIGLGVVLFVAAQRRAQALAELDRERRACDGGDAAACQRAGWAYEQGGEVVPDPARALRYYTRACEGGHALGCFFAGTLYESRRDAGRALSSYERACQGGRQEGCRGATRLRGRMGR